MEPQGTFEFGPFRLDPPQQQLLDRGKPVPLTPKAFATLVVLVRNHGRLVSKEELLQSVWPDAFVEESTLAQNIFRLRRLLGDDGDAPLYIETIPKRGYRFIAPVSVPAPVELRLPPTSVPPYPVVLRGSAEPALDHSESRTSNLIVLDPASSTRRKRRLYVWVTASLVAIAAATLVFATIWPREIAPRVLRSSQLTTFGRAADPLAVGSDRLFIGVRTGGLRQLAQIAAFPSNPAANEPLVLPTTLPRPHIYDVSSDGSQLLLGASESADEERPLWIMPSTGGAPRRVGNLTATGAAFSPDGSRIVYGTSAALYLCGLDGSSPRLLANTLGTPLFPRWSPDARVIRYTLEDDNQQASSIWEVSAAGGPPHPLLPALSLPSDRWGAGYSFGSWTRDGRYFFFVVGHNAGNVRDNSIWVRRESSGFLADESVPRQIFVSPLLSSPPVPSRDGKRLFFTAHQEDRQVMKYDLGAKRLVPFLDGASVSSLSYSPDNAWIAYVSFPNNVLWLARGDGSHSIRLVDDPALPFSPVFSPDGSRIAFHDARDKRGSSLAIVPRDGGLALTLTHGDDSSASWFPDGQSILYLHRTPASESDPDPPGIYRIAISSGGKTRIPGSEDKTDPTLSPDARFIAAPSENGRSLHLFNFASQRWTEIATGAFLRYPRWSRDSRYLYFQDYYQGSEQPVYRIGVPDGKPEKVVSADDFQRSDVFHGYLFHTLAPDGSPIVSLLRNKSDVFALDLDLPK